MSTDRWEPKLFPAPDWVRVALHKAWRDENDHVKAKIQIRDVLYFAEEDGYGMQPMILWDTSDTKLWFVGESSDSHYRVYVRITTYRGEDIEDADLLELARQKVADGVDG